MKRFLIYIACACATLSYSPAHSQTQTQSKPQAQGTSKAQPSSTTPEAILQQFFQKLERQTLTTQFTISVQEGTTQQTAYSGDIQMHSDRFLLTMMEAEAAYDGSTLYLYQSDINELTLSTPTQEELLEANPILYAKALLLTSTLRFASQTSSPNAAQDAPYIIEFIPSNKASGISKFVLKLRRSDLLPLEIQIREDKTITKIHFRSASFTSAIPVFKMQKKGAFINDLR